MNNFIEILKNKIIEVISLSSGKIPVIEQQKEESLSIISYISSSMVVEVAVSGDIKARVMVALPKDLSILISGKKIGATQKIFSKIFDLLSDDLLFQSDMPRLFFKVENILFVEKSISLESFNKMFVFSFLFGDKKSSFMFIVDDAMVHLFSKTANKMCKNDKIKKQDFKFPLRVRFGTKKILLEDFLKMREGIIVKLDQTIDDFVDILLCDFVIAQAKIVTVDGGLGIKIVKKKTKEDILTII